MAQRFLLSPPPPPPRRSSRSREKQRASTEHPFAKYRRSQLGTLTLPQTTTSAQSASADPAVVSTILASFDTLPSPVPAAFELEGSDIDIDIPRTRRSSQRSSQRSSLRPPDALSVRSASPLGSRSVVMEHARLNAADESYYSDSDAAVPPTVPTSRSFSQQSSRPEQKTLKSHRASSRHEVSVSSDSFGSMSTERDDLATRNKLSAESWVRQGIAEHDEAMSAPSPRLRRKISRESLRFAEDKVLADTPLGNVAAAQDGGEEQVIAKVLSPVHTPKERIYLSDSDEGDDTALPPLPQALGLAIALDYAGPNGMRYDEAHLTPDTAADDARSERLSSEINKRLSIVDSVPTRTSSLGRKSRPPGDDARTEKKSKRRSLLRTKTDDTLTRQTLESEASPVLEPFDSAAEADVEMLDTQPISSLPEQSLIPDSSWTGLSEEDSTVKRIRQLREMKMSRLAETRDLTHEYDSDESPLKRPRPSVENNGNDGRITSRFEGSGYYERDIHTPNSASRGPTKNFSMPTPPTNTENPFRTASDEYLDDKRVDQPLPTPARSASPLSSGNGSMFRRSIDVQVRSDTSLSPTLESRRAPRSKSKGQRWYNDLHPDLPEELGRARRRSMSDANYNTALRDSIEGSVNDYLSAPRLSRKVRDRESGRTICFSEVGDPEGNAVFICVGMGLTRYVTAFFDELASTLGLRLVTIDRPGVGGSQPYPHGDRRGPLNWSSDVLQVCQELGIEEFSLLAHSAGAVYALATALVLPEMVRGKIHLLAPWIPPSQLEASYHPSASAQQPQGAGALPRSQRILRVLPASVFKAANSSFISTTSASLKPATKKQIDAVRAQQQRELGPAAPQPVERPRTADQVLRPSHARRESMMHMDQRMPTTTAEQSFGAPDEQAVEAAELRPDSLLLVSNIGSTDPDLSFAANSLSAAEYIEKARKIEYTSRLTHRTWELATKESNPATDLLVCLERYRDIGFRYTDIDQAVVITHGTEDKRVPVGNVKWLAEQMNIRVAHNRDTGTPEPEFSPRSREGWEYNHGPEGCEIRVLEGEDHGLMASASIMSDILEEIAEYWRSLAHE